MEKERTMNRYRSCSIIDSVTSLSFFKKEFTQQMPHELNKSLVSTEFEMQAILKQTY